MSARNSWGLGAAIVLGCLILGLTSHPSGAVPAGKIPEPPEVGRYQLAVQGAVRPAGRGGRSGGDGGGAAPSPITGYLLLDTATGRVWQARRELNQKQEAVYRWVQMVPPLDRKAKK